MKLAIFDFDGTLFEGQAIAYLMHVYKTKNYGKAAYNHYMLQVVKNIIKYKNPLIKSYDKEHFRRDTAILFLRMFNHKEESYLKGFMKEAAHDAKAKLRISVLEELKKAKEAGYHTVLLSGCYTLLLQEIANEYGIDTVIGTDLETKHVVNNVVQVDTLDVAMGKRKVEKLKERFQQENVDWESSKAYGDSSYDYDILSLAGEPIAVCPDEGLLKIAQEKQWQIIKA